MKNKSASQCSADESGSNAKPGALPDNSLSLLRWVKVPPQDLPANMVVAIDGWAHSGKNTAGELVAEVKKQRPTELGLFLARTDDEARARGWPCIGAMAAALGIAAARTSLPVVMLDEPPPKAH